MARSGGSGGIGDSGIFGGIGIGTTVQCPADDQSNYCRFARLMNILGWGLMILIILYFVFIFLSKKLR